MKVYVNAYFVCLVPTVRELVLLIVNGDLVVGNFVVRVRMDQTVYRFLRVNERKRDVVGTSVCERFLKGLSLLNDGSSGSIDPP